ncbi:MarR family winged helix-turn-helix transcriptional regulator [Kutzneria sp. NPDC052558]|uniref:MarR family winged helix-turn-helix transcriptional regulator n=1 Tax=Kutzneria sp. NPDC052558 TaxID=3364121 RepID=UPI0037CCB767
MNKPATTLGVVDGLVQLSFLMQRVLGEACAEHDLSIPQARMLGVLRDREPGMLELAGLLNVDKSSATGLVDRAEKRGLVRRVVPQHNRRAVLVSLTPQGQRLAHAIADEVGRAVGRLTDQLSARDRAQLDRLITGIVQFDAVRPDTAK